MPSIVAVSSVLLALALGAQAPVQPKPEVQPDQEDASFWSNPGVNTRGLVRAGLEALHLRSADAASTTGGSSITQQLVKNVYISADDRYKRSYKRKLKETIERRNGNGKKDNNSET